jgi:hypothetical protein
MNVVRHASWMMNPNLSGDQVMALIEKDAQNEAARFQKVLDDGHRYLDEDVKFYRDELNDPYWKLKVRRSMVTYLNVMLPVVLCS